MIARSAHRVLGLILLLPILGWAATGVVFFIKPGYGAAYGGLTVRALPLESYSMPEPRPGWLEVRALRTVLGDHVLVRRETGWTHLDARTLEPRELPDEATIRRLLQDAVVGDRARYGEIGPIARLEGGMPSASAETTTGVEIALDWSTMHLSQSGRDTRRIDALYRVHYLQWTGVGPLYRVLGVAGLTALVALAVLGVRLAFGDRRS